MSSSPMNLSRWMKYSCTTTSRLTFVGNLKITGIIFSFSNLKLRTRGSELEDSSERAHAAEFSFRGGIQTMQLRLDKQPCNVRANICVGQAIRIIVSDSV